MTTTSDTNLLSLAQFYSGEYDAGPSFMQAIFQLYQQGGGALFVPASLGALTVVTPICFPPAVSISIVGESGGVGAVTINRGPKYSPADGQTLSPEVILGCVGVTAAMDSGSPYSYIQRPKISGINFNNINSQPFIKPMDMVAYQSDRALNCLFTGSISATTLTVSVIDPNYISPSTETLALIKVGQYVTGSAYQQITACTIQSQLTNTNPGGYAGREGTYSVSVSQTVASQYLSTQTLGDTLVLIAPSNYPEVGMVVSCPGLPSGTTVTGVSQNYNSFVLTLSASFTAPCPIFSQINMWQPFVAGTTAVAAPSGSMVLVMESVSGLSAGMGISQPGGVVSNLGYVSQPWIVSINTTTNTIVMSQPLSGTIASGSAINFYQARIAPLCSFRSIYMLALERCMFNNVWGQNVYYEECWDGVAAEECVWTNGGIGWNFSSNATPPANAFTGSQSGTTLTVTVAPAVPIVVNSEITGSGMQPCYVTALGTGTGGTGTYTVSYSQGIASQSMNSQQLPGSPLPGQHFDSDLAGLETRAGFTIGIPSVLVKSPNADAGQDTFNNMRFKDCRTESNGHGSVGWVMYGNNGVENTFSRCKWETVEGPRPVIMLFDQGSYEFDACWMATSCTGNTNYAPLICYDSQLGGSASNYSSAPTIPCAFYANNCRGIHGVIDGNIIEGTSAKWQNHSQFINCEGISLYYKVLYGSFAISGGPAPVYVYVTGPSGSDSYPPDNEIRGWQWGYGVTSGIALSNLVY